MSTDPILTILLYGSLAALAGGLGAMPFGLGLRPSGSWVGGAYALAGGLMLGAGHLLMVRGLEGGTISVVLGALAGVAYIYGAQRYAGIVELEDNPGEPPEAGAHDGYKIILQGALHASAEGVAIGVAMSLDLRLGIFLAISLAVHNTGEAMALADVLCRRGMASREAAGLCVIINIPQPLLAVFAFALVRALEFSGSPGLSGLSGLARPALLGFAAGSLVFLVLTDLLPGAYRRSGRVFLALLISATAGAVVLLESLLV